MSHVRHSADDLAIDQAIAHRVAEPAAGLVVADGVPRPGPRRVGGAAGQLPGLVLGEDLRWDVDEADAAKNVSIPGGW
jgi:hypothetical protein